MIRFFARHPTAANLLMIALLAIGLLSISALRRETFPDFTSTELEIRAVYPGATANDVETAVCRRIEDAIDGVSFVAELRAEAREGVAIVTAEMEEGADFQAFKDDIETEIDAIDDFPDEVEDPVITQLGRVDAVLSILVSASAPTPADLKMLCEQLKDRLQALPEVSLVEIAGFSDRQLRVELSASALQRHQLSVPAIADTIARQSVDLPAGSIESSQQDILLRFVDERRTPDEIGSLIILETPEGGIVRLRELGRVVDVFETAEDKVDLDGRRAGILRIKKTKTQDTVDVARAVKAALEDETKRMPPGVEVRISQDTSVLVVDRLQMLIKNGWQGMLLVFLSMWLFFNLRFSFWVAAGLPVAFVGAFYFMPTLGLTINMLTMVGLLLALGLLMDDAIVLAENIATHLGKGKSGLQAAVDGTLEVKAGVLSSFLTTVAVFGPLIAIEGDIGKVLRVVPMILILVMAISLIEAFWILPSHLGHSLEHSNPTKVSRFRRRFDAGIEWVRENVVGRTIDKLLEWRYLVIGCVVLLLCIAGGTIAGGILKFQSFPDIDGDTVVARILLPQGTPLERTEQIVARVNAGLRTVDDEFSPHQPDGQRLVQCVYTQYGQNQDAYEQGAHVATVYVELLSADTRKEARIDDILGAWRRAVGEPADVISLVFAEPAFGPAGRPIEIRLSHDRDDLDELKQSATELTNWLRGYVGVFDLSDDLRKGKEEIRIRLKEGALGIGLDASGVAQQLRAAFYGSTASEIQVGSESFEVDVRLSSYDRDSRFDLDRFRLTLDDGSQVPLSSVADVVPDRGWARIARIDGRRTATVRGDLDARATNTNAVIAAVRRDFLPSFQERHPDVRIGLEGEVEEGAKTQNSMMQGMLIGLIGVFILLSFQFRSYLEPLVVMAAIPCAFIGVVAGHLLLGYELSMPSLLGFVSLAGVVVNDSILLVEFTKIERRKGVAAIAASALASRSRFRAVTLTSLTTVMGLLPLLFEQSLQAQVLIPLAISIVFGILASTLLVLLVIPCLYSVLDDFGLTEATEADE